MLQDPLDDPAPVGMGRQAQHLPTERVDYELKYSNVKLFVADAQLKKIPETSFTPSQNTLKYAYENHPLHC